MPERIKLTAAEAAAVANAVNRSATAITGAANPWSTSIRDAIRRTVQEAHADFGIARSVMEAIEPTHHLGLPNTISAGTAALSDLTAARISNTARSALETFQRVSGHLLGEEARSRAFAGLVGAGAAPAHGVTAALGIEHSGQSAADTFARLTNLHPKPGTRDLNSVATPVVSAADHIAQMRSAMYPTTSSWSDPMADARAAFQAAIPTMPTIPTVGSWSEWIADTRPTIYPAIPAMPVTGAWSELTGALAGHTTGLSRHLTALAGAGHVAFAELVRTSQRMIRETMGLSTLIPDTAAWMHDLVRDSTDAIAEMMRSLWPLADGGLHAAQLALQAALRLVGLLNRGAPQAPAAVRDFLIKWLGFPKAGMDLVASATLVLMKVSSWLPDDVFTLDFDPRPKLRSLTMAEHRAVNRLSIDERRTFRGAPLLSLDEPVVAVFDHGGAPTVRGDRVADPAALGAC